MKHFNLKTLTIGAALAGSLFAGNVYAQEEDANLDLGDVKIVTLQLGTGNCIGINNSNTKKWEGKTYFGTPNGPNGRVGFIKAGNDKNQYYIASQGVLLKIDENGKSANAASYDDATLFNLKGTTASFYLQTSDETRYLSGATDNGLTTSTTKPGTAFNITNKTTDISVGTDGVQEDNNGYKFYSIAIPYSVKKPVSDNTYRYYTFVFSKEGNEIKAKDVDVVPAGVPFLYVTNNNATNITIPTESQNYELTVPKNGNVLDGFFYAMTEDSDLHTTALTLGKNEKGQLGYYKGKDFGDKTAANRGYFEAETAEELGAAAFELDFDKDTGTLTVKIISAETDLINACVALATELQTIKSNMGEKTGKYNVVDGTLGDDKTVWENLSYYTDADNAVYNIAKTELEALKAQLEAFLIKVKKTNVTGLEDVAIVTLQYNTGRYIGINGGTGWKSDKYGNNGFGTPNNGNGRIGLVKKDGTNNEYYIASQGLFLKADNGTIATADSKNDATAFITICELDTDNKKTLTFLTEDGSYLGANDGTPTLLVNKKPDYGFKVNSWDDANALTTHATISVSDDATQFGDYYYSSIVLPYKAETPTAEGYYAFVLEKNEPNTITAKKVTTVDAGVPFVYVSKTKGDAAALMTIPETGQIYSDEVSTNNVLNGFYIALQADDDLKKSAFALGTDGGGENNKIGYFSGKFENQDKPANRSYISAETADELNAESFELVYKDGTLTVNIVKPTVSVTITEAGWATLYSNKALDFSAVEDLTAYIATVDEDQTTVTLTEVDDVPAGTGVVLKGDDKEYKIPVATKESTTKQGSLKGSTTEDLQYDANKNYYILAMNNAGNVQFTRLNEGTVAAGKAYLELENKTDGAARVLSVVFEGETTGIVDANREATADGRIYNLNGQSVAQPAKGLYIVNGKKVVIK